MVTREEIEQELKKRKKLETERKLELCKRHLWFFLEHYESKSAKKFFLRDRPHLMLFSIIYTLIDRGVIRNVTFEMPPRHGKSYMLQCALAWQGGKHPETRNIYNTHTAGLYEVASRCIQGVIDSETFRDVFPDVQLNKTRRGISRWALNKNKFDFLSGSGIGGNITGSDGGNFLILDDEFKDMSSAMSEASQKANKHWISSAHDARATKDTTKIYMCTRWLVNDTIGRKKNTHDVFEVDFRKYLAILAEDNSDETILEITETIQLDIIEWYESFYGEQWDCPDPIWSADALISVKIPFLLENDEPVCPALMPKNKALRVKKEHILNGEEFIFEAEYQQNPYALDKGVLMFPSDELNYESHDKVLKIMNKRDRDIYCYIDPNRKKGSDDAVCVFGFRVGKNLYVFDAIASNDRPEKTRQLFVKKIRQHRPIKTIVEKNSAEEYVSQLRMMLDADKLKVIGKYNQDNKHNRIYNDSDRLMRDVVFIDHTTINNEQQAKRYEEYIKKLTRTPSKLTKTTKDDTADATHGLYTSIVKSKKSVVKFWK
jgi:predicted phage terminase large subunit-like protein